MDAEDQLWEGYVVRAADNDFLSESGYQLKLIADGYGPTEQDVWRAMAGGTPPWSWWTR